MYGQFRSPPPLSHWKQASSSIKKEVLVISMGVFSLLTVTSSVDLCPYHTFQVEKYCEITDVSALNVVRIFVVVVVVKVDK